MTLKKQIEKVMGDPKAPTLCSMCYSYWGSHTAAARADCLRDFLDDISSDIATAQRKRDQAMILLAQCRGD